MSGFQVEFLHSYIFPASLDWFRKSCTKTQFCDITISGICTVKKKDTPIGPNLFLLLSYFT